MYLNEEIASKFNLFIKEDKCLIKGISEISHTYINCVFEDIKVINDEYLVTIKGSNLEIEITINKNGLLESIKYIGSKIEEFENKGRKVISRESNENTCQYEYYDNNGNNFNIYIYSCNLISKGRIIYELLDENRSMEGIKDIYYAIRNAIDLNNVTLSIGSNDRESYLYVVNNIVIKYCEIRQDKHRIVKEYLGKDNKYYQEETFIKELTKGGGPFSN